MLKNYFTTAIRNLFRNKVYAILNVVGLALGIGCALVIFKVIVFEKSFDTHHSNYHTIYRIVNESIRPNEIDRGMGTPHPLGPALLQDHSEVKEMVRTHEFGWVQINVGDGIDLEKYIIENKTCFVENSYFKIFDIPAIAGNLETALTEPNTAVISKMMARKFFGLEEGDEEAAIGEVIGLGPVRDFKIVAVIQDPPKSTNFPFEILLEYKSQDHEEINPYYGDGEKWNSTSSNTNTWILTDENFSEADFEKKMVGLVEKYYSEETAKKEFFKVQPLSEIHSDEVYGNYSYATPDELILALGIVAVFLVITASINFVNLATAQSANRSKEIGIRKAIGGYKTQLIFQFFTEIFLITLIAIIGSLAIAEFLFSLLEEVIGTRLQLGLLSGFETLGFIILLLIVVTFLSGFYPSLLLSKMNTVMALKNKVTAKNSSGGLSIRKTLVVAQFAISQFLIIGTVIISTQMNYFLTKDLGFEKEAIIKTYLPERNESKNELLRQKLMNKPEIENVTYALSSPTGNSDTNSNFNYSPLNSEDDYHANYKCVDENYVDFYGIEILAGRNIEKSDSANYILVNQKVADLMGFSANYSAAIGERLTSGWGMNLKVIGVVKDFHTQNLSEDIQYTFLLKAPSVFYEVAIKTAKGANVKNAVTSLEDAWEKIYPEYVIDWEFFDEELAANYEQEQHIATLMNTFSFVSIIIGCLGLYGLIAFIAANRTKEVGIRKVLGASVISIIGNFSKEILVLVVLAFLIAAPLSFFLLNTWLDNYQFRISIGIEIFIIAFFATLLIAGITVSYRTISTALINPARTLKDE
ncbi:MAG: ABC transporter permease [Bacteroidota bacterium]